MTPRDARVLGSALLAAAVALSVVLVGFTRDTSERYCSVPTPYPVEAAPKGWATFEHDRVRFLAPKDLVDAHMLSEDSVVGSYKSPSLQVDFDFGWYSDDSFAGRYDGKVMRSGSLEATTVDGRPAQLAAWNDNAFPPEFPNVVALYVPDVDHAGEAVGEVKLSFTVAYRDPADVEIARRIVDSVSIAPSAR